MRTAELRETARDNAADILTGVIFVLVATAMFTLALWVGLLTVAAELLVVVLALADGRGMPWRADRR